MSDIDKIDIKNPLNPDIQLARNPNKMKLNDDVKWFIPLTIFISSVIFILLSCIISTFCHFLKPESHSCLYLNFYLIIVSFFSISIITIGLFMFNYFCKGFYYKSKSKKLYVAIILFFLAFVIHMTLIFSHKEVFKIFNI